MKKLIALFAMCTLIAVAASANIFSDLTSSGKNTELDINYYLMPINTMTIDNSGEKINRQAFFGLSADFNIFLVTSKTFDAGILLGGSFDTGYDFGVSLAPSIRITIADHSSFLIAPGLKLGIPVGKITVSGEEKWLAGINLNFNANLGYRFWLINNDSSHFGIALGANLGCPIPGLMLQTPKIKNGFYTNFYVGVAYNIGDRGFDTN